MTAEVAIVNSGAIALAADSAVTIGGQKIYNSAIKLFTLSKTEPVAIMIYGNANLLNVPWETLIKSFRKLNGNKKFDKLEEYSQEFFKYLIENANLFSIDEQKKWFLGQIHGLCSEMLKNALNETRKANEETDDLNYEKFLKILDGYVSNIHSNAMQKSFIIGMDIDFEKFVCQKYFSDIANIFSSVFEKINIPDDMLNKLFDISVTVLTRDVFFDRASGIVVAGFGDKEIYPSVITHEIESIFEGKLKYKCVNDKSIKIERGSDCSIIAFAQEDMVHTFMRGINPSIFEMLQNYMNQLFVRLPELMDDTISDDNKQNFTEKTKELLIDFFDKFSNYVREEHISPVLNMVEVLPKDELAAMAEALVHLTAFKRKMTVGMETVGGPIDVAVISKGDGLVWVKRKHYFPSELNQHFFTNYFRGLGNGNN